MTGCMLDNAATKRRHQAYPSPLAARAVMIMKISEASSIGGIT